MKAERRSASHRPVATTEMFKGFSGLDKGKTFRPRRHHKAGTKRYELHKYAQATLGAGNLHDAVTLPEGEDVNEWLAVNTVDFFNEMCTPQSLRGRRPGRRLTLSVRPVAATCSTASSLSSVQRLRAPSCARGPSTSTCGQTGRQ